MKAITKIGAAGLAMLLAGCATEKIKVDYVMPARAVADVSKVNVVAIKADAKVTGNLAGDDKLNAGLMKQLLSMRLYKEGFYKVVDSISGDADGAAALQAALAEKDAGHGYASFGAMDQGKEKATIELELEMSLDAQPVTKDIPFTLTTVNYKPVENKKKDAVPSSVPDPKATVTEQVQKQAQVYEIVATGTLKAKFVGAEGRDVPAWSNIFEIKVPEADRFDSATPSQLKAFAAAVSPAIDEIVADISPYRESRELVAIEGGDKRVVLMLNAKAFPEVVSIVNELAITQKANFADYENLGIALEATGDFHGAKDAYAKAIKANPESPTAKAGAKRVADALAGKKAVKAQGAKASK